MNFHLSIDLWCKLMEIFIQPMTRVSWFKNFMSAKELAEAYVKFTDPKVKTYASVCVIFGNYTKGNFLESEEVISWKR